MLEIWLPLFAIAILAGTWFHVLRLREHVTAHARDICTQRGLQLLDDSVALHRIRIGWRRGGLHIVREYRFETSVGGNDRQVASITLVGDRIMGASLPERDPVPQGAPVHAQQHASTLTALNHGDGNNVVPITRARRTLH
ncbi:MAG TPA: DUF3301 domain-containing protein [Rhodanobacteraceae bacterium]